MTISTDNDEQSSWSPDGRWIATRAGTRCTCPRGTPARPSGADEAQRRPDQQHPAGLERRRAEHRLPHKPQRPVAQIADIWVMDSPFGPQPGEASARPLVVRPGDERYRRSRPAARGCCSEVTTTASSPAGTKRSTWRTRTARTSSRSPTTSRSTARRPGRRTGHRSHGSPPVTASTGDLRHGRGRRRRPAADRQRDPRRRAGLVARRPRDHLHARRDPDDAGRRLGHERRRWRPRAAGQHADDRGVPGLAAAADHRRRSGRGTHRLRRPVAATRRRRLSRRGEVRVRVRARLGGEWQDGARLGTAPGRIGSYDCAFERHSFDQVLVQCDHRGSKKAWRSSTASPQPRRAWRLDP